MICLNFLRVPSCPSWTTFLLFLAAFICGCNRAPAPAPITTGPQFLALGDSYTIGESVTDSDRWPVQLASLLRAEKIDIADPQIIAQTGWTTDELSRAIDAANPQGPYALVTLLIGVNNQYRGRAADEFRGEFAALLDRAIGFAGGDAARVIVLSIPDWGSTPFAQGRDRAMVGRQIDQFNAVCKDECGKKNVAFVDITPDSKRAMEDATLIAQDGLHPSGKMYGQWAMGALPIAKKALSGSRP